MWLVAESGSIHIYSITRFTAKMLVTANMAMLKDRVSLCLVKVCLSVMIDKYKKFKTT